jgi:hypothetical protein
MKHSTHSKCHSGLDWWVILKCILTRHSARVCNGFIWLWVKPVNKWQGDQMSLPNYQHSLFHIHEVRDQISA